MKKGLSLISRCSKKSRYSYSSAKHSVSTSKQKAYINQINNLKFA